MTKTEAPKVYQDLESLIAGESADLITGGKWRPYSVTTRDSRGAKQTVYVVSNSPGNAALKACSVQTVKQKEIMEAALRSVPAKPAGGEEKS